jgi:hypothetical protein
MGKTRALNHIHKYFLFSGLWHCAECSHYKPGNVPPPINALSRCWQCNEPIVLTAINMKNEHPVCDKCAASPTAQMPFFEDWMDYRESTDRNISYEVYEKMRLKLTKQDQIEVIKPTNKGESNE